MSRTLIVLAALAVCTACTRKLEIEDVALDYDENRLQNIVIIAAPDVVQVVPDVTAMYVRLSPCDAQRDRDARYYPIVNGHVPSSQPTKLVVPIGAHEPQPQGVGRLQICAQLVADGMSIWEYRSNVVRVRRAPS